MCPMRERTTNVRFVSDRETNTTRNGWAERFESVHILYFSLYADESRNRKLTADDVRYYVSNNVSTRKLCTIIVVRPVTRTSVRKTRKRTID